MKSSLKIKMSKIKLLEDEFIKGSLVLFIMLNVYNFLNYMFHFSMARMLGAVDYGVLAVLMSIGYIFGVSAEAINNIVSRYTSKFNLKKEYGKMKNFLKKSFKKGFKIYSIIFLIYLPVAFILSFLLNISFWLLALTGFLIFSDLFAPIVRGTLQGIKKFTALGTNLIIEATIKLSLAVFLVYLGFKVGGAMFAVVMSVFIGILLAFIPLKKIVKSKEKKCNTVKIYSYSISFFVAVISITLMFSLDIIIARIFFSPEIVGKYAVASMLGKMIFFGTAPIGKVMFPFTSESFDSKKDTRSLLYKASIILFLLCLTAIIIFALFPKLIIGLLFGKEYVAVSRILAFMGISFSFLAFTNLIVIYALSKNRRIFSFYLPIFVLIEVSLLFVFSSTLLQYSLALLFSNLIMLLGAIILIKNESKLFKKV